MTDDQKTDEETADLEAISDEVGRSDRKVLFSMSGQEKRTLSPLDCLCTTLMERSKKIDSAQSALVKDTQKDLDLLQGMEGEREVHLRVCSLVQGIVFRLRMALACPNEGCGLPARLVYTASGYYQFEHKDKE